MYIEYPRKELKKINKSVVTIGNFDGCHLGHQKLIKRAIEVALVRGASPIALSFFPHPKELFNPRKDIVNLYTPEQRYRCFIELGLKDAFFQKFTEEFSQVSREDFVEHLLLDQLNAVGIVVGTDFHFGENREGNAAWLKSYLKDRDVDVVVMEMESESSEAISSTRVRQFITEGNVAGAESLLGHFFALEGEVCHGQKIGRKIEVPTVNLADVHQQLPGIGVYAGYLAFGPEDSSLMHLHHDARRAAINVGVRPTVGEQNEVRVEAHILDCEDDCHVQYGDRVTVYFVKRIRDEMKFDSLELLKDQITRDKEACLELKRFHLSGNS